MNGIASDRVPATSQHLLVGPPRADLLLELRRSSPGNHKDLSASKKAAEALADYHTTMEKSLDNKWVIV
jgi:hypothetical protein